MMVCKDQYCIGIPCNACSDAENDDRNGIGTLPATLLTNTIFPDFRAIIPGKMASKMNMKKIVAQM